MEITPIKKERNSHHVIYSFEKNCLFMRVIHKSKEKVNFLSIIPNYMCDKVGKLKRITVDGKEWFENPEEDYVAPSSIPWLALWFRDDELENSIKNTIDLEFTKQ